MDWEEVARASLKYMSEDEVEDMARLNDWLIADDEDLEEDFDSEEYEEYDDDEILTRADYDKLDFHKKNLLIGDIDIYYPEPSRESA